MLQVYPLQCNTKPWENIRMKTRHWVKMHLTDKSSLLCKFPFLIYQFIYEVHVAINPVWDNARKEKSL